MLKWQIFMKIFSLQILCTFWICINNFGFETIDLLWRFVKYLRHITKSLTQILLTLFEETYFLIPLSKQNCLINIHECIMFLNRKPCILKLFFSFWKNSVECVLSRFHYVYNRCLQLYYHIHLIYLVTYSFWMQKRRGTKKVE